MRDKDNNITQAFRYYDLGRTYNNSLVPNQYSMVNTNTEFFAGNQWIHVAESPAMRKLPRPVFNIVKRVTSLFVASLTSSNTTISFEPMSLNDGENLEDPEHNAAVYATAEVRNLLEKFKFDYRVRDALFDGAITGDYCAHFYWDPDAIPFGGAFAAYRGEIRMEMIDGINVMFGNPNIADVERQPYILIVGRDTVQNLKAEAEQFRRQKNKGGGKASEEIWSENIHADMETGNFIGVGGQTEMIAEDDRTGKALFVYLYTKVRHEETVKDKNGNPVMVPVRDENDEPVQEKVDGKPVFDKSGKPVYKMEEAKEMVTTVHVTKATRTCVIFEDVDTGLSRYPIAWGNWQRQKNQYHGRPLVSEIIPNQIFINQMFAMVFRHLQMQGFPIKVYNADLIPAVTNEVGQAIGVHNLMPGQDMRSVIDVIQPADMSNQIVMAIDKAMEYTKDCLGATDAQMGNIRPDNTSALMVLQSSAEVPLENPRSGLYEWTEDIGAILLDMMGTYYGERPLIRDRVIETPIQDAGGNYTTDPNTGMWMTNKETKRVLEMFDFSQFKRLWFNVVVNTGATSYYSEIAMVQTLDNLRRDGTMDIIDYLERIPDKLIPLKAELIAKLKEKTQEVATSGASLTDQGNALPGQQGPQVRKSSTPPNEGAPAMGGMLDPDKALSNMPTNIQAKYNSLPRAAQKALISAASL